jgi:hypothetical protein
MHNHGVRGESTAVEKEWRFDLLAQFQSCMVFAPRTPCVVCVVQTFTSGHGELGIYGLDGYGLDGYGPAAKRSGNASTEDST